MRALVLVALVACGKGGGGGAGSNAPAAGSAVALASGSAGSAVGSSAGSGSAGSGAPETPQVSAQVTAARCDEPCLFLTTTPIADLATAYKAACGKDTKQLGFDDCTSLDVARNCIYAAHGKVYKKKKWKSRFAKKSWYVPDPSFKESAFTATEAANIKELYHRGKACKKGLHISVADDKRLAAWFDAFTAHAASAKKPAPPMPKVVMDGDGTPMKPAEFLADLERERADFVDTAPNSHDSDLSGARGGKSYVALDSYVATDGLVFQMLDKLPGDHAKLRVILIDFDLRDTENEEGTVNEGINVYFIYDDNNQLVAIAKSTYLLD